MSTPTTDTSDLVDPARRDAQSLWLRIVDNPRPAAKWSAVALGLLIVEFGAFVAGVAAITDAIMMGVTAFFDIVLGVFAPSLAARVVDIQMAISGFLDGIRAAAHDLPTLLSRELIPNQGYRAGPNGPWKGTFLWFQPAVAWAIRVALVLAYSLFSFYWLFHGWKTYRRHYRRAQWTPLDDVVDRLRGHRWGQFGLLVLILFLTMALFGPTLGTSTLDKNIISPYSYQVKYFSEEAGEVKTVTVGRANFNSKSKGSGDQNVGPMTYDKYGRFHPFGTLPNGRDLFTFMMAGARITLIVTGLAIGLSALIAVIASLLSSYYAGVVDLTTLTIADGITSVPQLLILIMVSVVFQGTWIAEIMDSGFLLALVFAFTSWPFLWRAVRGPGLQVSEEAWIDAAESFGERPPTIMRKHMFPYIVGYLLVYASMSIGSIVIYLSALSFLGNGLGINPPTPAWGRAISLGQDYVSTQSWHISFIPGAMIVILVTGMNALGDGIRDAIDPESEGATEQEAAAGGAAA